MTMANAPLFGPRIDYNNPVARQQAFAYQLMNRGSSTAPVQSPIEGIARALEGGIGGYLSHRADEQQKSKDAERAAIMAEALRAGMGQPAAPPPTMAGGEAAATRGMGAPQTAVAPDPARMAQILASNPDTAPYAMSMIGVGAKPEQFGSPVKALGSDGKPVYVQVGTKGSVRPLSGYAPPPDKEVTPSTVQEWEYFNKLPDNLKEQYLTMKRANRPVDIGGSVVVPSMTQPGAVSGEIPKTVPPEQTPEVKGRQTTAVDTAKADVKKQELRPKAEAALADLGRQTQFLGSTIDKAVKIISPWSTGYGNWLAALPETDARELNNLLDTIKANVGFDTLNRMRQASPTGGALGGVSEMENKLLQAVNGALDPKQSGQLKQNLLNIKTLYDAVLKEKKAAFNKDYGDGGGPPPDAPPPDMPPSRPPLPPGFEEIP